MSTLKEKKAALLAKLARQKAKQKEQIFTIPTINLSTKEKHKKEQKTSIPTSKTLDVRAKSDDKMRQFMTELSGLSDEDVKTSSAKTNPTVFNGYNLFIKSYKKDAVLAADDPDVDWEAISQAAENTWKDLPLFSKKIWILKAYGKEKQAEWGREKFTRDVELIIHSENSLDKFISIYLKGAVPYGIFVKYWQSQRGNKEKKEDIKEQLAEAEKINEGISENIRLAITEKEQGRIDDLKERLSGYEDALSQLEEKFTNKYEILSELSQDELVEMARPIVAKKTKEQLVDMVLNAEYGQAERNIHKESEEFKIRLNEERDSHKINLEEMSYTDLVLDATTNKTTPQLIELLLNDEFYLSRKNLKDKIFTLGLEIRSLSLGKYVPRQPNVKRLKYKERQYREAIIVQIRRLELQTKFYEELAIHASAIGAMKDFKYINPTASSKQLIDNILNIEFPGYNISDPIPKITAEQMRSVLLTLNEDQIHVLAFANGIQHPEKRGKIHNIDSIIRKEFPYMKKSHTQKLVVYSRESGYNFNYFKRQAELEGMSTKDLKTIALTLDLNLQKGTTNDQIIKGILEHEKYISLLVPEKDHEKEKIIEKITEITGFSKSKYRLWSLEELKQRLEALKEENQEFYIEMEKERLYKKLSQIVDIDAPAYKNAKQWSLKKLRQKLEKAAGSNWEEYKPLIEDYSFVKCMQTFSRYEWIEGKVTGVWLSGVKGNMPKGDYIFKDIKIEEEGHFWYQANKKFFALQCNDYKKDRRQNGDVLTCYTQAGKPVKLMVGFTIIGYQHEGKYKSRTHMVKTNDGRMVQRTFIIQDEVLFNKEKEFIRRSNRTESDRLEDILNSTVSETTADTVMRKLSASLLEIAPMKSDYGIIKISSIDKNIDYNTPYMQILMATLRDNPEQTNKELFTKAASILVFLNMPESKTFRNNIANEYYLPDILATLSPTEKFPEAFQDPNVSGKFLDELTANINNQIFKIVRDFAINVYNLQDPTRKRSTYISGTGFSRSIKTRRRLEACANKERVQGSPDEQIVYYNENGKIYCFTIDELYEQILVNTDFNNPETGKPFDIAFVQRFDQLYNKKLSEDGILTDYFQKKYGFDMQELVKNKEKKDTKKSEQPDIAQNLWEVIGKDIAELEDQLSNEKPEDGDEVNEDREEERRDKEVNEGTRETNEIDEKNACEYCKKHLSDDSIKSIVLHGDESRIIKFCSFRCFEDKNDWSKYKAKRVRKKVNKAIKIKKKVDKAFEESQTNKGLVLKEGKWVSKSPTPVKLSRDQIKQRKKLIKKQIKEGVAAFDKVAFPLMSKEELREIAKEKKIKIPAGLSKMGTASFLYKQLHPKATKGVLKEKTAEKEMTKIETRKEKKRNASTVN